MGYVVAVSRKEADEIARDCPELIHLKKTSANAHLAEVKAPPTDSYYASQYRVYWVTRPSLEHRLTGNAGSAPLSQTHGVSANEKEK